jgi:hypothetical protein
VGRPPDIEPENRDRRVHEEACFCAEHAAGQPSRSIEARIEEPADRNLRAIRRSDNEELHIVEGGVEADGKPECAHPQNRVAQEQAQRDERDHIPDVLTGFVEVVIRREDEGDDDGRRPKPDALPQCLEEIGAVEQLFGDSDADVRDEPGNCGEGEGTAAAGQSIDLDAPQRKHRKGHRTRHDDSRRGPFERLPAESAIERQAVAVDPAALVASKNRRANESGRKVCDFTNKNVAGGKARAQFQRSGGLLERPFQQGEEQPGYQQVEEQGAPERTKLAVRSDKDAFERSIHLPARSLAAMITDCEYGTEVHR